MDFDFVDPTVRWSPPIIRDDRENFTVKRLGGMRKARNQSKWYASMSPKAAKQPKRHRSDIVSPLGLPTSCRMKGDERDA